MKLQAREILVIRIQHQTVFVWDYNAWNPER